MAFQASPAYEVLLRKAEKDEAEMRALDKVSKKVYESPCEKMRNMPFNVENDMVGILLSIRREKPNKRHWHPTAVVGEVMGIYLCMYLRT